ncbi:hypothetical protein ColLi_03642 [Colletotrichum liriopes]|uniref:Extracellular membrane protein CFEM domain-containing protein n=1 Tax=Colletotrichum liriopes TaxID=708192 RepID=A0AA37GH04_9PEZI|nr:hypothetical protein ColLi_03642 [Colletotrichum liriopes]
MLMRLAAVVGVSALLQLAAAQRLCYYPNGEPSSDVPCEISAPVSMCCTSADVCLPDGLCRLDDTAQNRRVSSAHGSTCTDPSWTSDACVQEYLPAQDSRESSVASPIARRALGTTTGVASTATAAGSSGSGGGLSTGAKAGIGIGVALGIIALAAAGYFQRRARLRKRASSPGSVGDEKRVGGQEAGGQDDYEMGDGVKGHREQTAPVICEGGTCSKLRMVGA